MKRWTEAVKPAPPVTRTPLQDAGVMADQILQGNVVEANLNDGTFTRLMDEFRRRGYELAKRSGTCSHSCSRLKNDMTTTSDEIKEAAKLEDIINEDEPLTDREHARYRKGKAHDSLTVDVQQQYYVWNSRHEAGDVYTWLQLHRGLEFKEALVYLAKRYGLEAPRFSEAEQQALVDKRSREEVFTCAARFFHEELLASKEALEYVASRGWNAPTGDGRRSGRLRSTWPGCARMRFAVRRVIC